MWVPAYCQYKKLLLVSFFWFGAKQTLSHQKPTNEISIQTPIICIFMLFWLRSVEASSWYNFAYQIVFDCDSLVTLFRRNLVVNLIRNFIRNLVPDFVKEVWKKTSRKSLLKWLGSWQKFLSRAPQVPKQFFCPHVIYEMKSPGPGEFSQML